VFYEETVGVDQEFVDVVLGAVVHPPFVLETMEELVDSDGGTFQGLTTRRRW
jgi:hypothetical protein